MRFVETPVFTATIQRHLDDEQYRRLQIALMLRPEQGPIIRASGGLRKVRWARPGGGTRRFDARTDTRAGPVGSGGVQMKKTAFEELLTSVRQAGRIRRGAMKPSRVTKFIPTDVRAVRTKLGTSQTEFALMIGVSVATLRNWEQGRRTPDGPALALLRVASRNPKAVIEALHTERKRGAA
jgi:putative transcriptional regulator